MRHANPWLVCGLTIGLAGAAQADGTFFQFDVTDQASDTVFAGTRGPVSFGANYSIYEGGWSVGTFVSRDFAIEGLGTVKLGPSFATSDARDDVAVGGKIVVERYQPTSFGFMFLSAQYNTIDDDWFTLAQFGNGSGLSVDLTAGGSDTYSERAIALNRKIGDGPASIRAGYRFEAESVFFGFSVNTY